MITGVFALKLLHFFWRLLLTVIVGTGVGLGAFVTAGEALMEILFPLRLYL